jgi:hypothetical protein
MPVPRFRPSVAGDRKRCTSLPVQTRVPGHVAPSGAARAGSCPAVTIMSVPFPIITRPRVPHSQRPGYRERGLGRQENGPFGSPYAEPAIFAIYMQSSKQTFDSPCNLRTSHAVHRAIFAPRAAGRGAIVWDGSSPALILMVPAVWWGRTLNALARSWEGEPHGEPWRNPARTEPRPPGIT